MTICEDEPSCTTLSHQLISLTCAMLWLRKNAPSPNGTYLAQHQSLTHVGLDDTHMIAKGKAVAEA